MELARANAGATAPALPPTLARGDEGAAVVELQRRLNAAGAMPPLKEDGGFGEKTEKALKAFQLGAALAQTGIADGLTWAALLALAAARGCAARCRGVSFGYERCAKP